MISGRMISVNYLDYNADITVPRRYVYSYSTVYTHYGKGPDRHPDYSEHNHKYLKELFSLIEKHQIV